MKKTTTKAFLRKKGAEKIVMTTAYDAVFARIADSAGVDAILIGDSLGNTLMGRSSTVPVTMDDMLRHTAMVSRTNPAALVVADVPFAVAHYCFDELLRQCAKLLQEGGADAVKIEGGAAMAEKIRRLTEAGIPVMGHIGLMPQQILKLGSYRTFGADAAGRESLLKDAKMLEEAGAFSFVIEKTDPDAAREITASVQIPTIGIGAGPDCDGQVLVSTDLLGLGGKIPPFAKKYAELGGLAKAAFEAYASEVRAGAFPAREGANAE